MAIQEQPFTREAALEAIYKLRQEYSEQADHLSNANEAKTRLLLIDYTLNALGWPQSDFNPEEPIGRRGYIDYLLKIDNAPRLVVEAKKIGHTFGFPRRRIKKNHYTLQYLRSAFGSPLTAVLEQARSYAMGTKVPFAVLTNGSEWLLVQLSRSPGFNTADDLFSVYFGNLLTDDFRFDLFWELLCRTNVGEGSIESYFAELNAREADFSRTLQAQLGTLQWKQQPDTEQIRAFYDRYFDDITDAGRRNMLEKCFVTSSELNHYQGELQRTLKDSAPAFAADAIELSPENRMDLFQSQSGDRRGRVALVMGSVGCGKTTLIHKVLIEARKDDRLICVVIDLINEVTDENIDVPSLLWQYLMDTWRRIEPESYHYSNLCKIFGLEISQLKDGARSKVFKKEPSKFIDEEAQLLDRLSSDPRKFLSSCWRYYQQKRRGIVVVFDNVDRASQGYQQQVYAFAHRIADETGVTAIVTMREFTFFRGKEAGFLDVRSSDRVFHLQTPNLIQVLARRINYVKSHQSDDHRLSKWKRSGDWESFQKSAERHSEMLKNVFLTTKEGQERLSLLQAVSWHNIRYFFQLLRQVHLALGSSVNPWTISEIVASLMAPPSTTHGRPAINNIFRPPYQYQQFQSYFLKLRILLLLLYGQQEYETKRGTSVNQLLSLLSLYGYHTHWTKQAIADMVRERFLECLEAPTEEEYTKEYELSASHSFRPSPLAVVLINSIVEKPVYLCLMGNDLPFHNPNTFDVYKRALQNVYETLASQKLERDVIDLLPETALGKVVATYLVDIFSKEQPPENLLNHVPEIGAAEDKLSRIVNSLQKFANVSLPAVKRQGVIVQPSLFPEDNQGVRRSRHDIIPIPTNLLDIQIGRSEYGSLIFWALAQLKSQGVHSALGVDIAEVINEYLVDDHSKKAPNNVSRALRGKTLQSQPWLLTTEISQRKKIFGLADDWQAHWREIFDVEPPRLEG
jgi:hypothetical protein